MNFITRSVMTTLTQEFGKPGLTSPARRPQQAGLSMRFVVLALLAFVGLASSLQAHPVDADNRDRTLVVRLSPTAVIVEYRLEAGETIGANDLPPDEKKGLTSRTELHQVVCRYFSEVLPENLDGMLDGTRLRFRCTSKRYAVTDHLCCNYRFEARWSPQGEETHSFQLTESNWITDDFSKLSLHLAANSGVTLLSVEAPSEALIGLPGADRKPGDGNKLRRVASTFRLAEVATPGAYKPALPPDQAPLQIECHGVPASGKSPPAPEDNVAWDRSPPEIIAGWDKLHEDERPDAAGPLPRPHSLLALLLDSQWGIGMVLVLAAILGGAHALTPGHGKTLVAAYLIGERGTIWHAVLLGVVVTWTHTIVVIVLAVVLLFFPNAAGPAEKGLQFIGGLLIAGLGFWILLRRLGGQADHLHIGGGHHHHHHDPAPAMPDARKVDWRGLVMLGIGGGMVPCFDAIIVLGFAITAKRTWLGLPMVLAFSAGLASVLVLIGIGVVCARNLSSRWLRLQPLIRTLPLLSAVVVTVLGFWLCYQSVHGAGGH